MKEEFFKKERNMLKKSSKCVNKGGGIMFLLLRVL